MDERKLWAGDDRVWADLDEQEQLDLLMDTIARARAGHAPMIDPPPSGIPVVVEAVTAWDTKGETLEHLRDLAQCAREGSYQIISTDILGDGEPVVLISAKELGRLGVRAGFKPDQKYANLLRPRVEGDLTREESIAAIDAVLAAEGYERIGDACSVGRRSVWMRLVHFPEDLTPEQRADREALGFDSARPIVDTSDTVAEIHFRAGREGDDFQLMVCHNNWQFNEILELCTWLREARFNPQGG